MANRMKNHRNLANIAANRRIDTVTKKPARGMDSSVESQLNESVDGINPDRVRVQVHQSPVQSQRRITGASIEGTGLIDNRLFDCCCAVFPTGRFFGRITQKGPSKNVSGRTNLWQNFGRIFPEMTEKGQLFKMFCFLYFSHVKHKKIWNFHRCWYWYCMISKIDEMKSKVLLFPCGRIFYSAAEFLGHSG